MNAKTAMYALLGSLRNFQKFEKKARTVPEHRMHIKTPKFQLAQRGDFALQSAQYLFSFKKSLKFVRNVWKIFREGW